MEESMDYWIKEWKNSGITGWNDGMIHGLLDRGMEELKNYLIEIWRNSWIT